MNSVLRALQKTYYYRNITIDKVLSSCESHKNGMYEAIHNRLHPITVKNNNKGLEHLLPIGSLILPDLGAMAIRYGKKLHISNNKYYNLKRYQAMINEIYNIGVINKSIW